MGNKLSGSRETDDEIFADFTKSFPDLNVAKFSEDDIKSTKAKAEWREFCERWKHLEDYSLGSLLRLDSSGDYNPVPCHRDCEEQGWLQRQLEKEFQANATKV